MVNSVGWASLGKEPNDQLTSIPLIRSLEMDGRNEIPSQRNFLGKFLGNPSHDELHRVGSIEARDRLTRETTVSVRDGPDQRSDNNHRDDTSCYPEDRRSSFAFDLAVFEF